MYAYIYCDNEILLYKVLIVNISSQKDKHIRKLDYFHKDLFCGSSRSVVKCYDHPCLVGCDISSLFYICKCKACVDAINQIKQENILMQMPGLSFSIN